jgi:hypothetical protein
MVSPNTATVPAGQVVVTGGAHGSAPHGPSTGAVGAAGGGVGAGGSVETPGAGVSTAAGGGGVGGFDLTGGFGAATGAGGATLGAAGGFGAGWSEMTASTGPRTSTGASIDPPEMVGSAPAVGPTGFTAQAADPKPTATTTINCPNLIVSLHPLHGSAHRRNTAGSRICRTARGSAVFYGRSLDIPPVSDLKVVVTGPFLCAQGEVRSPREMLQEHLAMGMSAPVKRCPRRS